MFCYSNGIPPLIIVFTAITGILWMQKSRLTIHGQTTHRRRIMCCNRKRLLTAQFRAWWAVPCIVVGGVTAREKMQMGGPDLDAAQLRIVDKAAHSNDMVQLFCDSSWLKPGFSDETAGVIERLRATFGWACEPAHPKVIAQRRVTGETGQLCQGTMVPKSTLLNIFPLWPLPRASARYSYRKSCMLS